MKLFAIALLLLSPAILRAEKPKPNPADFTITVDVIRSRAVSVPRGSVQHLDAMIDGKPVALESAGFPYGVLALGDYKAHLATTSYIPKNTDGFDIFRVYRFLLPDGTTRDYNVVGFGSTGKDD